MHYHIPKPFYRKSRSRWYVELGGRQINLGANKDQAFKSYYQLMAAPPKDRTASAVPSEHCPSVAELCDHFLEWVERNRAPDTYEWYRYRLQRFIDHYPDMVTSTLKPYHVENWVDSYTLSQTSRRNYFRAIKRCLKWSERQGYIDKSPIQAIEVPAGERRDVYISEDEFKSLLGFVTDENFRDLLIVTYSTGCRPQESIRVQSRHVDLRNNRWVFPQQEAKCKREPRIVYLSDEALTITTNRMDNGDSNANLFRNSRSKAWTKDAVNCCFDRLQEKMVKLELQRTGHTVSESEIEQFMTTLKPQRMKKGTLRTKTVADLRCEAKVKLTRKLAMRHAPRFSLYALRHSWATNALKRGVDSLTVAILMGHRDPSMLAKVYQHLGHNPEHMHEQAKRAAGGGKEAA